MYKQIVKDDIFLNKKAIDATIEDVETIGKELLDTLLYNREHCVGLAANMIGYNKRIICYVSEDDHMHLMFNPIILSKSDPYKTKEGCLSHKGEKETIRYKKIKVQWLDNDFKIKIKTFTNFTAQIIQHEMDHLEGILI